MPVAIPLAIVGSAIAGAAISGSAAKSAANTQAAAANQATAAQQQIFDTTQQNLKPFIGQGAAAGSSLQQLLGTAPGENTAAPQVGQNDYAAYVQNNPDLLSYWENNPNVQAQFNGDISAFGQNHYQVTGQQEGRALPTYSASDVANYTSPQEQALQNLPGYQFTRDQGVQTVNRQLGSMGLTGAQAKGISRFVTGLADTTYNGQVQNLQNATNTGESAAAGQGAIGATTGSGISNTIVGAGTAQAAGTVGAANAANSALSSIPGALLTNSIINGGNQNTNGIFGSSSLPASGNPLDPPN